MIAKKKVMDGSETAQISNKSSKRSRDTQGQDEIKNGKHSCGRWTNEEHENFIDALKLFGKNWKKVEDHVTTRTGAQIRSHAQKFFLKVQKKLNIEKSEALNSIEAYAKAESNQTVSKSVDNSSKKRSFEQLLISQNKWEPDNKDQLNICSKPVCKEEEFEITNKFNNAKSPNHNKNSFELDMDDEIPKLSYTSKNTRFSKVKSEYWDFDVKYNYCNMEHKESFEVDEKLNKSEYIKERYHFDGDDKHANNTNLRHKGSCDLEDKYPAIFKHKESFDIDEKFERFDPKIHHYMGSSQKKIKGQSGDNNLKGSIYDEGILYLKDALTMSNMMKNEQNYKFYINSNVISNPLVIGENFKELMDLNSTEPPQIYTTQNLTGTDDENQNNIYHSNIKDNSFKQFLCVPVANNKRLRSGSEEIPLSKSSADTLFKLNASEHQGEIKSEEDKLSEIQSVKIENRKELAKIEENESMRLDLIDDFHYRERIHSYHF